MHGLFRLAERAEFRCSTPMFLTPPPTQWATKKYFNPFVNSVIVPWFKN